MLKVRAGLALLLATVLGNCSMTGNQTTLIDAVLERNPAEVRRLIDGGSPLEQVNHKGETPLIIATMTDQFRLAEVLLEAGANPFAASAIGWTPGFAVEESLLRSGPEFEARQRVQAKIIASGYPIPGPDNIEIMKLVAAGNWPPREWAVPQ